MGKDKSGKGASKGAPFLVKKKRDISLSRLGSQSTRLSLFYIFLNLEMDSLSSLSSYLLAVALKSLYLVSLGLFILHIIFYTSILPSHH